jgi:transcriptional regulator with XRE-family HTH domain
LVLTGDIVTTATGGDTAARMYDHEKLRAWREERGLSRERVGVDNDLSAAWLQTLELGGERATPSLETLVKLARYYGHRPGELLL